ncbi:MAG: DUF2232 domain-containing protein [Granulosicoccus sp.]|nr:DUF2232 domain-containing protein [Granulosicoccus sp.]
MIAFARIADRGPVAAAVLAAVLLLGALWIPALLLAAGISNAMVVFAVMLSMFALVTSAAVVAFVALRHGEIAALQVAGGCLLLLILLSFLLYGSAVHIPLFALIGWLPAIIAAFVLARTVRLELAVLTIIASGLIAAFGFLFIYGDTTELLQNAFGATQSAEGVQTPSMPLSEEQLDALVENFARAMPGAFGLTIMIVTLAALFLARSWQADIVNPGGFQKEFHALKFGRHIGLAGVLIILLAQWQGGQLSLAIAMIVLFGLFLQGLAVSHALVKQRNLHPYWLYGIYILIFTLPHTLLLLAALGLADNLFSLRNAQSNNF